MTCADAGWRDPDPTKRGQMGYGETWRLCRWCGSIHPDDLLAAIRAQGMAAPVTEEDMKRWTLALGTPDAHPLQPGPGLYINEADWKYGYPHKLYIDGLPSAMAGQTAEMGSRSQNGIREPIMGTQGPTTGAKFYTVHLAHASEFAALAAALHEAIPGVEWSKDETGIRWHGSRGSGVR